MAMSVIFVCDAGGWGVHLTVHTSVRLEKKFLNRELVILYSRVSKIVATLGAGGWGYALRTSRKLELNVRYSNLELNTVALSTESR